MSSRSERAKKKQARPEDFMDDEDLAELRESRQLVDENEEMDFGGTESELRRRAGTSAEDECVMSLTACRICQAHVPQFNGEHTCGDTGTSSIRLRRGTHT